MSSEQQGPGHGDGHADGHSGEHALGHAHAQLGSVDYLVDLRAGRHRLQSDEPPSAGGGGAAPGPFALLLSGAGEGDINEPLRDTYIQRVRWLVANLFTAGIASTIIAAFGGAIEQMVALAILMPIVASIGGYALSALGWRLWIARKWRHRHVGRHA